MQNKENKKNPVARLMLMNCAPLFGTTLFLSEG